MNILFVMYGDFRSNSAHPMALHARELATMGHACAAAVPSNAETAGELHEVRFTPMSYSQVLAAPGSAFPDGRSADVIHAWTPREGVRLFVTEYQSRRPTPWILYHEDNEAWIARAALAMAGLREDVLLQHTKEVISTWTPPGMPHPLRFESFIGLADAAVVIQDKLAVDVPPWVRCTTVMPGVDLEFFRPLAPDPALRRRHGVDDGERVIVYPGGLNDFTRPGLESLARAVGLINERGTRCRLLRSGPVALDFLDRLPPAAAAAVTDLGALPREELPGLLALADAFVQPGKHEPFEDLRLPGKLPELLAAGRPVLLPDTNIASLLRDGVDAVILRTGTPEEIADKCLELFADPGKARQIGEGGRRFAETHFDPRTQAARLEAVYRSAREAYDERIAREVWTAQAADTAVRALLVVRLRAMAKARPDDARTPMLNAYATLLDKALERERGLEAGIAVRDHELAALKGQVETTRAESEAWQREVMKLREAVAREQAQAQAIGAVASECERRIAEFERSLSWRITAPLRRLMHAIGLRV